MAAEPMFCMAPCRNEHKGQKVPKGSDEGCDWQADND